MLLQTYTPLGEKAEVVEGIIIGIPSPSGGPLFWVSVKLPDNRQVKKLIVPGEEVVAMAAE